MSYHLIELIMRLLHQCVYIYFNANFSPSELSLFVVAYLLVCQHVGSNFWIVCCRIRMSLQVWLLREVLLGPSKTQMLQYMLYRSTLWTSLVLYRWQVLGFFCIWIYVRSDEDLWSVLCIVIFSCGGIRLKYDTFSYLVILNKICVSASSWTGNWLILLIIVYQ